MSRRPALHDRLRLVRTSARLAALVALAAYGLAQPPTAAGQAAASDVDGTVRVSLGKAAVVTHPVPLRRVSVANPEVAEAVVVSPTEVLLHGKSTGTTSLILWDSEGGRVLRSVEVALDADALEGHFSALFPGQGIEVSSSGNTYILSGDVADAVAARRAVEIATATGATVVDNMAVAAPRQILLQVRFAEVSRNALEDLGVQWQRLGVEQGGYIGTGRFIPPPTTDDDGTVETANQLANILFFDLKHTDLSAFIRALKSKGVFRSLAEPNLLAMDGEEASFLAGGEFPFPVVQGGESDAITIQFKEFGVRLNFTPSITNAGNITLAVAPEVSQLDFANGLQLSGFQIPAILSRRAETKVELADGQTFAIAGLIDNSITENIDKIPILGEIPILGALFSSKEAQQNRSELLVLVTPRIVQPSNTQPPVPTGEPEDWDWLGPLEQPAGVGMAPGGK